MHATLASRAISSVCVLAVALLLASCKKPNDQNYSIGGTVSGLTGTGLVLQNNGGDNLAVSSNGGFTFSTKLKKNASYSVTVMIQPSSQSCSVANDTGTVSGNVTSVAVTCAANASTVGGTVSGLTGTGLVLRNNGTNDLAISSDGAFTFSTPLANGVIYSVTVGTPPSGQGCAVANGSGSIAGANVTNVAVACAAPPAAPTLSLGFGVKELKFTWPAVSGADFYRLLESPNGVVSAYVQVATDLTALSYDHTIPVHRRINASYVLEACNVGGCTPSFSPLNLGTDLTQAIGYVKASNTQANDQFGFSVALSGDGNTLAVGAHAEDSSLTGVANGSVSDATSGNAAPGSGAVYVFARIAGTWLQQAYVKASNTGAGDAFGAAVALSGDGNTLAVGAQSEGNPATGIGGNQTDDCGVAVPVNCAANSGAVYVYTRTAGTWSQQAYVKASNTGVNGFFGSSVALNSDGNTLAVGAVFESSAATGIGGNQAYDCGPVSPTNCAAFSGAVYVFARSAGNWSQQAYVKASNTEAIDMFGNWVALNGDGNTLAVGAPREGSDLTGVTAGGVSEATSGNDAPGSGAVYVFARSAGTWSQQAYVKASNTEASDAFGMAVALSGDGGTLAVGSTKESSALFGVTPGAVSDATSGNGASESGAVYVFTRTAGTWSQQAYVKASNTEAFDQFGTSVALSGDGNTLAVGAQLEDGGGIGIDSASDNSTPDAGAVYVYARSAGNWSQQAYVKASNTRTVDRFGNAVALNGDGNTLAVGALKEDGGTAGIGSVPTDTAADAGAVYLY